MGRRARHIAYWSTLAVIGTACIAAWLHWRPEGDHPGVVTRGWLIFGFGAQALFTARFLVQWIASERAHRSVVPPSFWWLSVLGSLTLGLYFVRRGDPVGFIGQMFPVLIYARNLWMLRAERRNCEERVAAGEDPCPAVPQSESTATLRDQPEARPEGRQSWFRQHHPALFGRR